ncbi:hypothetical protein M153_18407000671, partial [Pseudoloma neurophilia]
TGSAFNLITQQAVLQIPSIKVEPLDKPVFITLLDGRSLVAKFKCILIVTFGQKSFSQVFYIFEKAIYNVILCNNLVKMLKDTQSDVSVFPVYVRF